MNLTPANCVNCQAPLEIVNPAALCNYCNTSYLDPTAAPALPSPFLVMNDVLVKYDGSDAVVIIPDQVRTIGPAAFAGHAQLRHVMMPDSVMEIDGDAFTDCPNLCHVTMSEDNWNYFFAHFPHSEEGAKRLAWQAEGKCTRCGGKIARLRKQCKQCYITYKEK